MKTASTRRRTALVAVTAALALGIPAVAAQAATSARAQTSGGVIQRTLAAHGSHFSTEFNGDSFPDFGLTLDGVIAMDAAGVGDYRSEQTTSYVADHIKDYVGDGTTESYAGATAKALFVSLSQNVTPSHTLGGVDLLTALEALEQPSGRFSDKSQFGDFSNTFGQVYALVALQRSGDRPSYPARNYLNLQQCPNGGFRIALADTRCATNAKADTDATSMAVQGLLTEPAGAGRTNRIKRAVGYLKTQMVGSGGVKGGAPTDTANSNSTGLAAMSFASAGYTTLAGKARGYLVSMRFGCAYPASMRGAVAYDAARKNDAKAQGSKATLVDQDNRSTAQAVLGFSGKPLLAITNTDAKFSSPTVPC